MPDDLPAVVKWGKQRFTGVRLRGGMPVAELKRALQALSGVPPERQKLSAQAHGRELSRTAACSARFSLSSLGRPR